MEEQDRKRVGKEEWERQYGVIESVERGRCESTDAIAPAHL